MASDERRIFKTHHYRNNQYMCHDFDSGTHHPASAVVDTVAEFTPISPLRRYRESFADKMAERRRRKIKKALKRRNVRVEEATQESANNSEGERTADESSCSEGTSDSDVDCDCEDSDGSTSDTSEGYTDT